MSVIRPSTYLSRTCLKKNKDLVFAWHRTVFSYLRSFPSSEKIVLIRSEPLAGKQIRFYVKIRRKFFYKKYTFRLLVSRDQEHVKVKMDRGDFRYFEHQSRFIPQDNNGSELVERIEFTIKYPWFFKQLREKKYRRRFEQFFYHKHECMLNDIELFEKHPFTKPLRILITGSNGLIGSNLENFLMVAGHEVWKIVRSIEQEDDRSIYYNMKTGEVDRSKLEKFDVVIHLWGHSIQKRWTKKTKQKILESRSSLTKTMAKIFAGLQHPPKMFLSASAIGYYGDRDGEVLTESSDKGKNSFLSDVAASWEEACSFLQTRGVRVVNLRFGVVLSLGGGALAKMLPLFKVSAAGTLGSGAQYMSWISIEDVVGAIYHVMMTDQLSGPVNVTSPHPVTNKDFTTCLASCLKRPVGPRTPKFLLRLFKGEMVDELLFASTRAFPQKLLDSGYSFRYGSLPKALRHLIKPQKLF